MLYNIKQVKRLKIRNQRVAGSSPVVSNPLNPCSIQVYVKVIFPLQAGRLPIFKKCSIKV